MAIPLTVKHHDIWVRTGPYGDDSVWVGEYWTDQHGNEYNSVEHLLLCVVAEALRTTRS